MFATLACLQAAEANCTLRHGPFEWPGVIRIVQLAHCQRLRNALALHARSTQLYRRQCSATDTFDICDASTVVEVVERALRRQPGSSDVVERPRRPRGCPGLTCQLRAPGATVGVSIQRNVEQLYDSGIIVRVFVDRILRLVERRAQQRNDRAPESTLALFGIHCELIAKDRIEGLGEARYE